MKLSFYQTKRVLLSEYVSRSYKFGWPVTHLEYPKRCAEVFICPYDRRHDHYSLQAPSFSLLPFPLPEHAISSPLFLSLSFCLSANLFTLLATNAVYQPLGSSDSKEPRGTAYHSNGLCVVHLPRTRHTQARLVGAPQIGTSSSSIRV